MSVIEYKSSAMNDDARCAKIFDGVIIVFKQIPAMIELCSYAQDLAKNAFAPHHPLGAHEHMPKDEYLDIVSPLQRGFTNDQKAKELFARALEQCGVDPQQTYWDWFPMRIQPPSLKHRSLNTSGYSAHRDSWFSSMYAQSNWWGPLYPIDAERTMNFYPCFFNKPVPNTSEGWDLQEFRTARAEVRARNGSDEEVRNSYRFIKPLNPLPQEDAIRLVPEVGDLICFSAAHLHETIPNMSAEARFSTEIRTVRRDHILNKVGAPAVDDQATGSAVGDFSLIANGASLQEHI